MARPLDITDLELLLLARERPVLVHDAPERRGRARPLARKVGLVRGEPPDDPRGGAHALAGVGSVGRDRALDPSADPNAAVIPPLRGGGAAAVVAAETIVAVVAVAVAAASLTRRAAVVAVAAGGRRRPKQ